MRLTFLIFCLFLPFFASAVNDYEKALTAFNSKKIDDAYIYLKNALKNKPDNIPAKILMGKVLLQKSYFYDGVEILRSALFQGADINLLLSDLGNALMILRNYEDVIALGHNKNLTQENQLTWLLLSGNAYSAINDDDNAKIQFEKALTLSPKSDRTLSAFAAYELSNRNFSAAEILINKALSLYPNQSRIWHLKGRLYNSKSDQKNALAAYEKAYKVNLSDPFAQRALAHAYTQARRFDEALILVDKILVITPEDPFAKLLQSQLLASTDQNEEANQLLIDISQKLSLLTDEQKNNNVALAYVAGTAAYIQNDLELAQQQLLLYVREKPQDLASIRMLVNIYLHQGQLSKAQDLLESQEQLIANDLLLSLKLVDIYLNNRKLYKVEPLLKSLEAKYKDHDQLIIAKVNWLTKTERFEQAITLLNQHQPKTFNAAFLLTKGLVYRAQKQLINAHDIADILLTNSPVNIDYLSFKGSLLLEQKLWLQAITMFEKILINKPEHFSSLFNTATAYAALQQFERATEITTKLIKSHPQHLPLKILMAKVDQDTGNIAKAIESLTNITEANSTNIPATESLIKIYYQQKNFEAALRESDRLTKLVILNPKYIAQKAEIYIALQDLYNAKKQLKILSGTLTSAQEFYQLSQLQFKAQDINAGKLALAHALSLQPNSTVLLLETAKIEMQQGNLIKSNEILVALEKNNHNDANVLLIRGDWLLKKNQKKAANKKYLSAFKIDNNFNAALVRLYKLTLDNIGTDVFNSTLTTLLKQQPDRHFIRNLLADHQLNVGDTISAKSHYEILIKQDFLPTKSIILNNLANILIKTDLQYAEETAQQALALDDTSSAILDTYGWIKSLRGNHSESLVLLRQAFAINSIDPVINYHLGYTLIKLGRVTEAKQELMHALANKSDFIERSDVETLLKSISN